MVVETHEEKREDQHVTITRKGVTISCLIVLGLVSTLWALTPHKATIPPEYVIATTLQQIDPQTKTKSETIYATETAIPASNQNALRTLFGHIKPRCTTTLCGIELYDNKITANEAYLFDTANIESEPMLLSFNRLHPGITEAAIDAHFIAEYMSDSNTIATHPLRQNAGSSTPDKSAPANASAKCNDGAYGFSPHASGSCTTHQGVQHWY